MIFKLNESKLNEAFHESMPEAVRQWLSKSKYYTRAALNTGVDLNKAVFHEVPIPTSNRDPFFKMEDKVRVMDLGNGNIYMTSVNDDNEMLRPDGKYSKMKYLPAKVIMEVAQHLYYIDPDENNARVNLSDLRNKRIEYRDERANNPNFPPRIDMSNRSNSRMYNKYDPAAKYGDWQRAVDKSGYLIDPNRLKKKMAKLGLYNPSKKINAAHENIITMRNQIHDLFTDIADVGKMDNKLINNMSNAMSSLATAARRYNNLEDMLAELNNKKKAGTADKNFTDYIRTNIDGELDSIKSQLDTVNYWIREYLGTVVDWDTDEDDI